MSEVVSDVLEDMVRTELTRQSTAPQPDPDRILHRVRITRRRTTTMTSAAVMVLVIVVGATVWSALPRTGLPEGVHLGEPAALWFADPDHGYALVDACPIACQLWLAVTTDGGRNWHGHPIPGLTAQTGIRLRGLSATTVVVQTPDGKRLHTNDSGATWNTATATGRIDHIPPGAAATIDTPADGTAAVTVHTTDGNTHQLATPPAGPLTTTTGDIHLAADGSAWIRGTDRQRPRVLVSRDRGRTWHDLALPPGATTAAGFTTHDGKHLYHAEGTGVWAKTGDHGTWQPLHYAQTGTLAAAASDTVTRAQPDGGVLLADRTTRTGLYYAAPGDTTLHHTTRTDLGDTSHGARQLRTLPGRGHEHTADGKTWTLLPF